MKRAAVAVEVACLLVHAKDEDVKSFYLRYGFEPFPAEPLHLILMLKDIPASLTR